MFRWTVRGWLSGSEKCLANLQELDWGKLDGIRMRCLNEVVNKMTNVSQSDCQVA